MIFYTYTKVFTPKDDTRITQCYELNSNGENTSNRKIKKSKNRIIKKSKRVEQKNEQELNKKIN